MFVTNLRSPKAAARVDDFQTSIRSLRTQLQGIARKLEMEETQERRRAYQETQEKLGIKRKEFADYLVSIGKGHLVNRIE